MPAECRMQLLQEEKMRIIVDSSALFYGFLPDSRNEYYTSHSVLGEIRGKKMRESIELRLAMMKVQEPSDESLAKVREIASRTRDLSNMSSTDVEIIALAMDVGGKVMSNDLAIQNVCRVGGIEYIAYRGKEIRREIEWKYRCTGCGRIYETDRKTCPHCGNDLKRIPNRTRVIR